jgi:hypothetical protein
MVQPGSVRITVTVSVSPSAAFEAFTADFDTWYRKGVSWLGHHDPHTTLYFEPHQGGRLLELGRDPQRTRELARIAVWEPGQRLVFVDWRETEVDVRFDTTDAGTRIVLDHRGLERLPVDTARDVARYGWSRLAGWFEQHMHEVDRGDGT